MPIALSLAIKLKQTWSRLSQAKLRPLISFVMASSSAAGGGHENADGHHKPNRLIHEKSPYLLQHAHNPVDWYPWGPEAFEKAKRENKLIFLSVGYSTCHWCHVMERESFEDPAIGAIMNSNFVNIKVDREERPDVDKIYMSFVQATTGSGGWPMSVWLTPDLKPIVGGTYFPPDDRYFGRPGFSSILKFVSQQWHEKPEDVTNQGTALTDALIQASTANASSTDTAMPDLDVVERCYSMIGGSFDPLWGGFGNAPKFPQPVNFEFMLRYAHHKEGLVKMKQSKPLEMVSKTLQMMSRGGIHDHVAQGFHRYSTDKKWHVPHFEKMLYDQGQLAVVFAEMFQVTGDTFYAEIVDDILSYVSRDLSHPEGGFYSAEDADSLPTADAKEKKEGAFCVWTDEDVRATLCDPIPGHEESELTVADVFCKHYSVSVRGNLDPYQDPHGELLDQNVLIVLGSLKETAEAFKLDESKTKEILKDACKKLFEVRCQRPKPHLDTKVLLAWNGLMISGFAKAGAILERAEYVDRAVKAAEFVRKYLTTPDGRLLRSVYAGEDKSVVQLEIPVLAFADDYAFFLTALLDLYDATLDPKWVNWSHELQERMNTLFWDSENWGYFTSSSGDPSIIIRLKEDQDGAEPSSNSVAAVNLLRLSALLDQEKYREQAKKILMAFGKRLVKVPVILPKLICAYLLYLQGPFHLVVVGPKELEGTKELLKAARSFFVPNRIVIHLEDPAKGVSFGGKELEFLKGLELVEGKPACYPCKGFTCQRPVTSAAELLKILQEK